MFASEVPARATATIALCGIKFFYERTLERHWTTPQLIRPPREKKLPVVLSREEVRRALAAVRIPVYRACLTTIYAGGLRLSAVAGLARGLRSAAENVPIPPAVSKVATKAR